MRYLNLIDTGMNKDEVSKWAFRYLIFIHEISGCLSQLKHTKLAFSAATYSSFVMLTLGLNQLDTSVSVSQSIDTSFPRVSIFLRYLHLGV